LLAAGLAFASALPAQADTTVGLSVVAIATSYNSAKLPQNAVNAPVIKYSLVNKKSSQLQVTKIGLKYTGTAVASSVKFTRLDNDGNTVLLGTATFVGDTAVVTGTPVLNIPVDRTRDILAEVTLGPSAIGSTAQFFVDNTVIDYQTATPPSVVDFPFPPTESELYVVSAPTSSTQTVTVLTPNGGETLVKGTKFKIMWNATYGKDGFVSKIELLKAGVVHSVILQPTSKNVATMFNWTVPTSLPTANNYKIRVYIAKGSPLAPTVVAVDTSDANFRIQN